MVATVGLIATHAADIVAAVITGGVAAATGLWLLTFARMTRDFHAARQEVTHTTETGTIITVRPFDAHAALVADTALLTSYIERDLGDDQRTLVLVAATRLIASLMATLDAEGRGDLLLQVLLDSGLRDRIGNYQHPSPELLRWAVEAETNLRKWGK
jgi:hypothetical protein